MRAYACMQVDGHRALHGSSLLALATACILI